MSAEPTPPAEGPDAELDEVEADDEPFLALEPAKDPAIVVDHISKKFRIYDERNRSLKSAVMRGRRARFKEFLAVDDVSFTVERGTTFGLVGENGCGKSTTLKCLTRTIRPEKGSITLNGKMAALLELGAGFHPELSGRENVYLNAAILGMGRKEVQAKFDDIVEFAGLERFIDMPVKNYSSGMYVRLGFAVAINSQPEILLVDEVLAVGDEEFQKKCGERFADIRDAGGTIVLVSHGLEAVRAMCDNAVWLDHGKVKASGPAGDVIDRYLGKVRGDRVEKAKAAEVTMSNTFVSGQFIRSVGMVHDDTGAPVHTITPDQGFRLRVTYDADLVGEPARVDFGIYRADGQRVGTYGIAFPVDATGETTVEMHVPHFPLQADTYVVHVALVDAGSTRVFERIDKFARFEVLPSADRHQAGMVDLAAKWEGVG